MKERTTDQLRVAALKFFEELGIAKFLATAGVKQKLAGGYQVHNRFFEDVKARVPDNAIELTQEVIDVVAMTEEEFNDCSLEFFQVSLAEILMPSAAFISVEAQIRELFQKEEDENLMMLLDEAMDDLTDQLATDFVNLLNMRIAGVPMEVAIALLENIGSSDVISGRVTVEPVGEEEDKEDEPRHCNGECQDNCNCQYKDECEDAGHCMCEE